MSGGHRLLLAAAVAAGAILRLWNLPAQILGGDELHAVRVVLSEPLVRILTTFRTADPSIPLAAFYRLLLADGIPLTEPLLRLPALAAGLASLVVVPWLVGRRLGAAVGVTTAWLVALSPLLVLYSRIARPYMPVALASFVAVAAFDEWWRTGGEGRRWGSAYAAAAVVAVWLHPLVAPFVLSPLAVAAGALLGRAEGRRQLAGRWLLVVAAVALGLVVVLGPALPSLLALAAEKAGRSEITAQTVTGVVKLLAGSGRTWAAALFWLLVLVGSVRVARRRPYLAVLAAVAAVSQVAAVVVLEPHLVRSPLVFARYLLPLLVPALVAVAAALAPPWRLGGRELAPHRAAALVVPVAAVTALALAGPFTDRRYRGSSFVHHNDFLHFDRQLAVAVPGRVPEFYRRLGAGSEPPGPVLELPWLTGWRLMRAPYAYQHIHRQPVRVVTLEGILDDERLRLAGVVPARLDAMLESGARHLVVHLDPEAEERALAGSRRAQMAPAQRRRLKQFGPAMAQRLERRWGPPDHDDGVIRVWDLERVRAAAVTVGR